MRPRPLAATAVSDRPRSRSNRPLGPDSLPFRLPFKNHFHVWLRLAIYSPIRRFRLVSVRADLHSPRCLFLGHLPARSSLEDLNLKGRLSPFELGGVTVACHTFALRVEEQRLPAFRFRVKSGNAVSA